MRSYLTPIANPAISHKWTLTGHSDAVRAVLWFANGKRLFSGGKDRILRRWELAAEQPFIERQETFRAWITGLVLNPEEHDVYISCSDGTMHTWSDYNDKLDVGDDRATSMITALATAGGRHGIASGGSDGSIGVWSGSYRMFARFAGHRGRVTCLDGSPTEDYIASGGEDNVVRIWEWEGEKYHGQLGLLRGHSWYVSAVAWHPSGTWLVSGSCDETLCCWRWPEGDLTEEHGALTQRIGHLPDWVRSLHWSYDGKYLACGCKNGQVWIFRAAGEGQLELWGTIDKAHEGTVYSVRWSPKGRLLATGSEDRTVKIWEVEGVGKAPPKPKRERYRRSSDDDDDDD